MPEITVLIPVLNEEEFIEECIVSVLGESEFSDDIEVLVIDGGSADKTKEIVLRVKESYPQVKLLDNPKKIVPAALNIGVSNAENDILVWLGAHATYSKDYVVSSAKTLLKTGAASVGGVLTANGVGSFGKALAFATSTKFGIGNAKYRYASQLQSVDTVFGGCWKKESVLKAGGFNEEWVRNQDFEFNQRLRDKVGEIVLDPSLQISYFVRESPIKLIKQYFQYGFWRFRTFKEHPSSLGIRQVIPVCLVLSLLMSLIIMPFSVTLGSVAPLFYFSSVFVASFIESARRGVIKHFLWLLVIYPIIHIAWGVGYIWSFIQNSASSNCKG